MDSNITNNNIDTGFLEVDVTSGADNTPIENALVTISYTGDPQNSIEELRTDNSGQTEIVELPAPPLEYSMTPSDNQPFAEYTITVSAPGFEPFSVSGSDIMSGEFSLQPISLRPITPTGVDTVVTIPFNTLFGDFPPKIPEDEIKPVNDPGEIVLSRVVVPEYVVVHDGAPTDSTAQNYYVRYRDYVKNVASSEIYSTWPDATLRANILAIMSFTMNRVYTEWYRNQ